MRVSDRVKVRTHELEREPMSNYGVTCGGCCIEYYSEPVAELQVPSYNWLRGKAYGFRAVWEDEN